MWSIDTCMVRATLCLLKKLATSGYTAAAVVQCTSACRVPRRFTNTGRITHQPSPRVGEGWVSSTAAAEVEEYHQQVGVVHNAIAIHIGLCLAGAEREQHDE